MKQIPQNLNLHPFVLLLLSTFLLFGTACNGHARLQEYNASGSENVPEKLSAKLQAECNKPMVTEVLTLANQARAQKNLSPLTCDARLTLAARLHAEDMCAKQYLSHTSKDGRAFHERFEAQDVEFMTAGENVAHGQTTPQEVHTGWMNSADHRKNILRKEFVRLGVGYAACGGRPYWVQGFAG